VGEHADCRMIRFGNFEVDFRSGELRRNGLAVKLQGQPFQVLTMLLERPGELVTREEIRQRLWPADTFVDFEHSLNAAVKRLRDALGESAENPVFIETLPRRGYRIITPIETSPPIPAYPARSRKELKAAVPLAVACALCALGLLTFYYRSSRTSEHLEPVVLPAVTDAGEKYTPNLSPDGQRLAFAWNGGSGSHFSLYVKVVGTEESLRLTNLPALDFNPVWSPDGRYIAFCRILPGQTGIYLIPALGGAERKLRATLWDEKEFYQVRWNAGRLSWSPDGESLAFSDHPLPNEMPAIFLLSLDSLAVRKLTSVPPGSRGDSNPAFSPDGKALAFTRSSQAFQSIYTVPVSGGEEQRLVSDASDHWGLAWTPDGQRIVFANASWPINAGWLWRVPVRGGKSERLQFGQEGIEPSIRGNRLAYVRQTANLNIWKRELRSPAAAGLPTKFISSSRMDSGPEFSPDGARITFESTRSGPYEVWMCRSDVTGLTQLTHFNSSTGTPRWSPDGRLIAFDSRVSGNADIYVLNSDGGPPRRLTTAPANEVVPSWSRDGRWLYFASHAGNEWEVRKVPSTGGPSTQVTHQGGFAAFESPDGKFLYYAKGLTVPGLWRVPTAGGEEEEIIGSLEPGYWGYWAVVENGIYYLDTKTKPKIVFFDLTTRRITPVFDLENPPAREAPGLTVSSDRKTILYTQLDGLNSEIMLVDNFR
jgi:Tol biopolymer transport system component/DNA-binding winged helix-turn-helix (wHTH) protein